MRYSVIIPLHNEDGAIQSLHRELTGVLNDLGSDFEIILVDDGSADGTVENIRTIVSTSPQTLAVCFEKQVGKSEALQAGFEESQGEVLITMDGDGQDDPADIPYLLKKLNEGPDLVIGWRSLRKDPWSKKIVSGIANTVRRLTVRENVHDVGCGLRAFKRSVIQKIVFGGRVHRFFTAIARAKGFRVDEVKVNHRPRTTGQSKYGTWKRFLEGLLDILRFCFFGADSLMKGPSPKTAKEIIRHGRIFTPIGKSP